MSGRRHDERRARLRLVSSAAAEGPAAASAAFVAPSGIEDDPLAEPSEEEVRAAAALRDALEQGDASVERGGALRAAFSPTALSEIDHDRILERALVGTAAGSIADVALPEGRLAPRPSRAEERAAAALRARVDADLRPDPDAEPDDAIEHLVDVAIALRSAHAPRALDDLAEARIRKGAFAAPRRRLRAVVTTFAALAVAAAAVFAIVPRVAPGRGAPATANLVPTRSTQPLFDPAEPFPREGGTSARIDRISASRNADLRQNQFSRWGIR